MGKKCEEGSEKAEKLVNILESGYNYVFLRDTRVSGKRVKGYTLPIIFCVLPQISTSR